MSLDLDDRQRAMLQEMGVRVWLPGTAFATAQAPVAAPAQAKVPERSTVPVKPVKPAVTPVAAVPAVTAVPPMVPLPLVSDAPDAAALVAEAGACTACGLCAGRTHSTLQLPLQPADWMVVGDPPDADEDAQGRPFAADAGVLLDNMLRALHLQRLPDADSAATVPLAQRVYVSNVLKCRPPHGTLAQPADLAQCAAYLQREIALVQPRLILAMGRFANQLLLEETPELATQPLGRVRGQIYRYLGVPVVVTYHPKALLRHSPDKAKAWADLCLAADTMDTLPPRP
jgi:uracil-DNA glycosylase